MFREMCVLYSFMRVTDDLGDDDSLSPPQRRERLSSWKKQLSAAFAGQESSDLVLAAMVDVARRREISQKLLDDVILGVESDLAFAGFQTFDQLNHYCYQVAGAVGLCCLQIWGYRQDPPAPRQEKIVQLAIDCGTAFQLTNILRDLAEDAKRDRIYLPQEDLAAFAVRREDVMQGTVNDAFRSLMQFEVERAWTFYRQASPLLEYVSVDGCRILSGFLRAYSSLLKEIERQNYDVYVNRVRLSQRQKLALACRSLLRLPGRVNIPG